MQMMTSAMIRCSVAPTWMPFAMSLPLGRPFLSQYQVAASAAATRPMPEAVAMAALRWVVVVVVGPMPPPTPRSRSTRSTPLRTLAARTAWHRAVALPYVRSPGNLDGMEALWQEDLAWLVGMSRTHDAAAGQDTAQSAQQGVKPDDATCA